MSPFTTRMWSFNTMLLSPVLRTHRETADITHTHCSSTALRGVRGARPRRGGQLECSRGRQEARRYRLDLDSISPDGTDSISSRSPRDARVLLPKGARIAP